MATADNTWAVILRCACCGELFDVAVTVPEMSAVADEAECEYCGFQPTDLPESTRVGRRHAVLKVRAWV